MGDEAGITCEEVAPDTYDVTCFRSQRPEELEGRMRLEPYEPKEGRVELEECATCGAPKILGEYTWDFDSGVIRSDLTGRRMALVGMAFIDPVFMELERELGEKIPRVVVEAQRRFS